MELQSYFLGHKMIYIPEKAMVSIMHTIGVVIAFYSTQVLPQISLVKMIDSPVTIDYQRRRLHGVQIEFVMNEAMFGMVNWPRWWMIPSRWWKWESNRKAETMRNSKPRNGNTHHLREETRGYENWIFTCICINYFIVDRIVLLI